MAKLKVTLTRSVIGRPETQRKTVKSLGLGKPWQDGRPRTEGTEFPLRRRRTYWF